MLTNFKRADGLAQLVWLLVAFLSPVVLTSAEDMPATIVLRSPVPYEVLQRQGYRPREAHHNAVGGPRLGFAEVPVVGRFEVPAGARCEYRVVRLESAFGREITWTRLDGRRQGDEYLGLARVPAGGWYRLEVRVVAGDATLSAGRVEPFGVGEVFLIAGQSYAAGANDELLQVEDPQKRVVACDLEKKAWRVADDPQPGVGNGGTIWPALGNLLVPVLRVPVGFVNAAHGGTSSRQWLPGEKLFVNCAAAGQAARMFRAVLWQQGESDVIEKQEAETYVKNLTMIRAALDKEWGFAPVWLPAKSTLHPTVYVNPEGEGKIRDAIDQLWHTPGFRPGPDTDTLGGENRGDPKSRRHFTGIGQRRAALLWFAAIWNELHRPPVPADSEGFVPLFDGVTLAGWEGDVNLWKVENGAIVGDSPGIKHNEFLATTEQFGDFELRLEFKLHGGVGNSGVQFRSTREPESRAVAGYQADIGESAWGSLFDEHRRRKVLGKAPAELEQALRRDDWNSYIIRAEGPRVTLTLNGVQTVDYTEPDDQIARSGIIALQVHSGPKLKVVFRKVRIKELP